MVDWHPAQNARPCEWVLRNNTFEEPYGVIRELRFGHGRQQQTWYRLVTWAASSAGRTLIGYSQNPKRLADVAWERHIALARERRAANIPSGAATTRTPAAGTPTGTPAPTRAGAAAATAAARASPRRLTAAR